MIQISDLSSLLDNHRLQIKQLLNWVLRFQLDYNVLKLFDSSDKLIAFRISCFVLKSSVIYEQLLNLHSQRLVVAQQFLLVFLELSQLLNQKLGGLLLRFIAQRVTQIPVCLDEVTLADHNNTLELVSLSIYLKRHTFNLALQIQIFIHDVSPFSLTLDFSVLHFWQKCACSNQLRRLCLQ